MSWNKKFSSNGIGALTSDDASRMSRLLTEAFEVALILCNASLETFCVQRIFDILCQIIPTAYVLDTSYWPLYVSTFDECLCLCGLFNIECPHSINQAHFINLGTKIKSKPNLVLKNGTGFVKLMNWSVTVNVLKNKYDRFYNTHIEFKTANSLTNDASMYRLQFKMEFCPARFDFSNLAVCFDPHPLLHPSYGSHIPPSIYHKTVPEKFVVTYENVPPFSVKIMRKSVRFKIILVQDSCLFSKK